MEFDYRGSFFITEDDMEYMVRRIKEMRADHLCVDSTLNEIITYVINDWASGLDDCDFYLVGLIEEDLSDELQDRLGLTDCWYRPLVKNC